MRSRPIKGLKAADAFLVGRAVRQELDRGQFPDAPNAKCERCGAFLRATPAILGTVRMGVADHGGCGGTFREIVPSPGRPEEEKRDA